ncbi:hypothetical protein HDV00_002419 [Rhizophlyctis rosea]|nr:hypothetical protein HDV00_002419 [Rhizophlyctis rosea]
MAAQTASTCQKRKRDSNEEEEEDPEDLFVYDTTSAKHRAEAAKIETFLKELKINPKEYRPKAVGHLQLFTVTCVKDCFQDRVKAGQALVLGNLGISMFAPQLACFTDGSKGHRAAFATIWENNPSWNERRILPPETSSSVAEITGAVHGITYPDLPAICFLDLLVDCWAIVNAIVGAKYGIKKGGVNDELYEDIRSFFAHRPGVCLRIHWAKAHEEGEKKSFGNAMADHVAGECRKGNIDETAVRPTRIPPPPPSRIQRLKTHETNAGSSSGSGSSSSGGSSSKDNRSSDGSSSGVAR